MVVIILVMLLPVFPAVGVTEEDFGQELPGEAQQHQQQPQQTPLHTEFFLENLEESHVQEGAGAGEIKQNDGDLDYRIS